MAAVRSWSCWNRIFNCRYSRGFALKSSSISHNYRASIPDRWIAIHMCNLRGWYKIWLLNLAHHDQAFFDSRAKLLFLSHACSFVIRTCTVINPAVLAATLSLFRPTGYPILAFHDPAIHVLWYFRTAIRQEADRRSTWVPDFFVFRWLCWPMESRCRLSFRKHQPRMTIPWHHGRRFKGVVARVAHEQGPKYAKVQRRPGSSIIPSLPASAWLCQDVQSLTLT